MLDPQIIERFMRFVPHRPDDGCWEWTGARMKSGYGCLRVGGQQGSAMYAHRLAYAQWIGPIPDGMLVLHRCDNRPCVRPTHLFLGTHADNSRDMREKHRSPRHKLNEDIVLAILQDRAAGLSTNQLAERYAISRSMAKQIVRRMVWRHVHLPEAS